MEQKDINKSIQDKIQKGEVHIRPKKYFILRIVGAYLGLGLLFFMSLLLVSFLELVAVELEEIALFPWYLLLVFLLFLAVALKTLDRSMDRAYKTPRIFTFLFLFIVVVILATVVARVPFLNEIFF